jgi:poly-gamma-glutamate system protein
MVRYTSYQNQNPRMRRVLVLLGVLSLATYIAFRVLSPQKSLPYVDQMVHAARIMERSIVVIRDYCDRTGIEIDETIDPNRTGLVGPELSGLVTTLGHLEAKRTTTNPDMAGLIVHLLYQAGVGPGDTVAIGSSASFPALLVASLAAAKAMDVMPRAIISLGSSSYGATKTDFHLLDMVQLLLEKGVFEVPPAAVALGGGKDTGEGFEPGLRERLMAQIAATEYPFIKEPDLRRNVALRMGVYFGDSMRTRISAFIHTGGSYANMGTSSMVLKVKPGLNTRVSLPPESERGVLFEMAARGIPIIHLLFIRGLAVEYGLPWDPIPLPSPGQSPFYHVQTKEK